ncbi:MAG: glycine--tRNA ligase subunit beta [Gammaproteobacteria bacterium]
MSRPAHEDLLIEIGTEELPAAAQAPLAHELAEGVRTLLAERGLDASGLQSWWGPRRLAVLVREVPGMEPDRDIERRGPSTSAAFDAEGKPTRAAEGFARSVATPLTELDTLTTDAGSWLVRRYTRPGRPLAAVLAEHLPGVLEKLPQPRRMRWGGGEASFLRPVRWLCVRLGKETVTLEAFGIQAEATTRGHRIHHPESVHFKSPDDYLAALLAAHVQADPVARRTEIVGQVEAAARALNAVAAPPSPALYDELVGLVEWPVALTARFDPAYLELPEAIVMTTLAHHQRFIPLRGADGGLLPNFIAIANLDSRDPEQIQRGLARVVRPRLDDARFYYRRDRERSLAAYGADLEGLQFAPKIGTMAAKTKRLSSLCRTISEIPAWPDTDANAAARAGELAKCDLVTGMVFEFPELQGIIGGLYAAGAESDTVATAIAEQYLPAGANDPLPTTPAGAALALADRLDTLVGGFSAGLTPSGTKDPFGLRRAAFGALRITANWAPQLDLAPLLEAAAAVYPDDLGADETLPALSEFLRERLRSLVLEQGERPDVAQAVLSVAPLVPGEVLIRAQALNAFCEGEHAASLAAANKRIANLLRQANMPQDAPTNIPTIPADAGAETMLAEALENALPELDAALLGYDFARALTVLAQLRAPVDRFFEEVLVMDPDPMLRHRRLALLARLRKAFLRVADIGELQHSEAA